MRTALCWDITHRVVLIAYGQFGTTYRSIGPLKMGPIGCPETSVRNYHYSLRNSLEESSSHLLRGGGGWNLSWNMFQSNRRLDLPVVSLPQTLLTIIFVCSVYSYASVHSIFPIHFEPLPYSFTLTINVQIAMLHMMLHFNQQISNNNCYNDNSYNKVLVSFMRLVDRLSTGTEL
jgi:hypothetical protein